MVRMAVITAIDQDVAHPDFDEIGDDGPMRQYAASIAAAAAPDHGEELGAFARKRSHPNFVTTP